MIKRLEALPLPKRVQRSVRVILVLASDIIRCDVLKQSSAMAYVTLLSLVPSLAAIFCILSLFSPFMAKSMSLIEQARELILSNLAAGTSDQVIAYLDNMLKNIDLSTLGWSAFGSVLITLILLLRQIEEALNRIWLIRKGRSTFTRFMYFWTFLTAGVVLIAIVFGASAGFNLDRFGVAQKDVVAAASRLRWLQDVTTYCSGFLFFFLLYKIAPNCHVKAKHAATGAAIAALALQAGGKLYAQFVRDATSYKTLYGALAQLPLFLTWLYICWTIILVGSLISWRMQEGFPDKEDDTLDAADTSTALLRNAQIKASLPWLLLLTIYKSFNDGSGRGLSVQDITQALKIPSSWIIDALDALESLGYVIASKAQGTTEGSLTAIDPYFPTFPAHLLTLSRLQKDLSSPLNDWMSQWHHELAIDLPLATKILNGTTNIDGRELTLADTLPMVAATQASELNADAKASAAH